MEHMQVGAGMGIALAIPLQSITQPTASICEKQLFYRGKHWLILMKGFIYLR